MRTGINSKFSYNKTLLLLSLLCIICAGLSVFFGEIASMAVAGLLAAIFVFETGHKRIYSFVVPIILVAINVVMVSLMENIFSIWAVISILAAYVIFFGYVKKMEKFDTALIVTGIVALATVISLLIVGMISASEFSINSSIEFYTKLYSAIREGFSHTLVELYSQISQGIDTQTITVDDAASILDVIASLLIGVLVIVSFFVAGVSYKIFAAIMKKYSEHPEDLIGWRFLPPAFFGHVYLVLVVAYFLLSNGTGVLATSVTNLYLIFMWVFAYVGVKISHAYLSRVKSVGFSIFILGICLLLFSSFALQILAMIGAFSCSRRIVQTPGDM